MDQNSSQSMSEYKPNLSPIIYWALAYGVIAGVLLFVLYMMAEYLTLLWFPVFAISAAWGAYRNYTKQKKEWYQSNGLSQQKKPIFDEVKEAFQDIADASREVMAQEQPSEPSQPETPQSSEQSPEDQISETEESATPAPAGITNTPPTVPTPPPANEPLPPNQVEDNPPAPPFQPK